MIWIFDSGSGWLSFLDACKKELPEYDYIYFGDFKNCPYGNREKNEILDLTRSGVLKLKNTGAKIVILACNTATWASIRELQKEEKILWVKILGVTIPGAEKIIEEKYKKVAVFATQASIDNHLYKERVHILDDNIDVQEIAMPELAVLTEKYLAHEVTKEEITKYILDFSKNFSQNNEAIVLWCTHYSLIQDIFKEIFPNKKIICPSKESAKKLVQYLQNHPEIEKNLTKNGKIIDIS